MLASVSGLLGIDIFPPWLGLALTQGKVCGGSLSLELFQHPANLLMVIQTCRRQALSLIEFFDQPMKAMVHSAFHFPYTFFNPSSLDLNPYTIVHQLG